jgi:hypothetical protein
MVEMDLTRQCEEGRIGMVVGVDLWEKLNLLSWVREASWWLRIGFLFKLLINII